MFVKINQCPVCYNTSFKNFIICKDYTVSGESFAIVECSNCKFKFTNPRPDDEVIGNYYESEDYISHSDKGNNLINILYKLVRNFTLKSKTRMVRKYSGSDEIRVLDVGCGTGDFLKACSDKGWEVSGVEPNDQARSIAESKIQSTVLKDIEELEGEYNVITLWHVLEHLPDLNHVLQKLKKHLKKKGKLIVAVPNADSYDAKVFKEYWAAYDVPRHFYHFTQPTMKNLLKNNSLKIKETLPMKFDSFYVSLLSNSYQYGSKRFLNSFITGLKSNSYGSKNNNNYSSLIYVINK